MSSPAKRRKKNDSSSQPARGLDYFFAKQLERNQEHSKESTAAPAEKAENGVESKLTDEDLARKLQEEYNREYQQHFNEISAKSSQSPEKPSGDETLEITSNSEVLTSIPISENTLSLQSATDEEDLITANLPLDENPLTFDPSKYVSVLRSHWAANKGQATYALLTRCFILVNATSSRIKIVDTLVNTLRTIIESDPDSLLPAVWLATNSISPPYIDLELGLGGSAISKALRKTCGLDSAGLRTLYSKYGDAGDVAFEAKKRQSFTLRKPKPLTIKSVFESLIKVANAKGQGSQEVKQRIIERLILDTRGAEESRYIVRTLVQHLRIGAVKTTMLIALSRAFLLSKPEGAVFETYSQKELLALKKEQLNEIYHRAEETVKACFARHPNYADIVPVLLEVGVCDELMLRCGLTLHIPLRPMLGSITRDLGDMLTRLQGRNFACEYKYDGQRAQVHCDETGRVSIFSRHLELMTDKYPDLVAIVPTIRGDGVSSFILEGEVVAINSDTGDLQTFQTLTNRAKKDVTVHEIKVNVCLFAFDLMYLNGKELLDRPFRERRSLLRSLFVEIPRSFTWVKSLDATSADSEAVLEFFKGAISSKCEGVMVKVLDNPMLAEADDSDVATAMASNEPARTPSKSPAKSKAGKSTPLKSDKTISNDTDSKQAEPPSRRKPLLATYEPDKRLDSWLKVKKDYNASADTIDLVPIAGWHGQGRKSKWWSPILLAAYSPSTGRLVAVTKCMSGFTDVFYKTNRAKYDPTAPDGPLNVSAQQPAFVEYNGNPEVWFEPQEVWEIAFADVTLSPTYTAGIDSLGGERGLSLRFPRFMRVREDKGIEEASSEEFLADLWFKQKAKAPEGAFPDEEDEEGVE